MKLRPSTLLSSLLIALIAPSSFAYTEEEDVLSYDAIVSGLNREANSPSPGTSRYEAMKLNSRDPFDSVWMHGGVGVAAFVQSLSLPTGEQLNVAQKGMQASFGIDLFSQNWMAEGTARSFGDSEEAKTRVNLKEFELKVYYKSHLNRQIGMRVGGGLAARYMTIQNSLGSYDYSTPSSVGTFGLDFFLNERFSIGADLSGRTAMISDTIDRGSADATLRLDAHF